MKTSLSNTLRFILMHLDIYFSSIFCHADDYGVYDCNDKHAISTFNSYPQKNKTKKNPPTKE